MGQVAGICSLVINDTNLFKNYYPVVGCRLQQIHKLCEISPHRKVLHDCRMLDVVELVLPLLAASAPSFNGLKQYRLMPRYHKRGRYHAYDCAHI